MRNRRFLTDTVRYVFLTLLIAGGLVALLATGGGDGDSENNNGIDIEDDPCNYTEGIESCKDEISCHKNAGSPYGFMALKNKLIFVATAGCRNESQRTIFELDNAGALTDIYPISFEDASAKIIDINDVIYLFIDRDGLYKYDGNEITTVMTVSYDESIYNLMAYNNILYYIYNSKLYSYDGVNPPVLVDETELIDSSIYYHSNDEYIIYNDKLYFIADNKLWCYDKDTDTLLLASDDISNSFIYGNLIEFNDKLYFSSNNSPLQLWMIDGDNEPVMAVELSGTDSSYIRPLVVFKEKLLCLAGGDIGSADIGTYLWEYDNNSLAPVTSENLSMDPFGPIDYALLNDHFYFVAVTQDATSLPISTTYNLWDYDGANTPVKKSAIAKSMFRSKSIYPYDGKLLIIDDENSNMYALPEDVQSRILIYDGTSEPTVFAEANQSGLGYIGSINVWGDNCYLTGESEDYGSELWNMSQTGIITIPEDFDFYPGTTCECI